MLVHSSIPMLEKPTRPDGWNTAASGDPRANRAPADLGEPSGVKKVAQSPASACLVLQIKCFQEYPLSLQKKKKRRKRERRRRGSKEHLTERENQVTQIVYSTRERTPCSMSQGFRGLS